MMPSSWFVAVTNQNWDRCIWVMANLHFLCVPKWRRIFVKQAQTNADGATAWGGTTWRTQILRTQNLEDAKPRGRKTSRTQNVEDGTPPRWNTSRIQKRDAALTFCFSSCGASGKVGILSPGHFRQRVKTSTSGPRSPRGTTSSTWTTSPRGDWGATVEGTSSQPGNTDTTAKRTWGGS